MKHLKTRLYLGIIGALLAAIGFGILVLPHASFASYEITLGSDPNHLSEVRVPGGLLFASGIAFLLGGVLSSSSLVVAMTLELAIGVCSLLVMAAFKPTSSQPQAV